MHGDGGNYEDAIICFERALALKPHFPDAFAGLLLAKDAVCDWTSRDAHFQYLAAVLEAQLGGDGYDDALFDSLKRPSLLGNDVISVSIEDAGTPLIFHGQLPCVQPLEALRLTTILAPRDAQRIARRFAARARANLALSTSGVFHHHHHVLSSATSGRDKTRIHVGYLSANFGNHPVSHLLAPVLVYHDRSRFLVTCYSLAPSDGTSWRTRLEHGIEGSVKDIGILSSSDAARLIHADGVHILIPLDGHTANAQNEIIALRPAPVQVGFVLGFPGTFGADYVDYLVVDEIVIGPTKPIDTLGTPHDIDEHVLILPNSCILNGHAVEHRSVLDCSAGRLARETYGLPQDAFVFAYFGDSDRIDPIIFSVWMSILKRVPNSLLWLHMNSETVIDRLKKEARGHQVIEQRLIFSNSVPRREHVFHAMLADIVLDTPACNALDATLDALWAGTPVIALLGNTIATRTSASLCSAVGCHELISANLGDYEDLAISLAIDSDKYWIFRQKLEHARRGPTQAPLFDFRLALHQLEAGYEAIWARVVEHQRPTDIIVG